MTDQYGANCRLHPGAMFKPSDGCPTCAVGGDPYVLDANGFIPEARTSKAVTLPGWMECSEKDERGEPLSALERFILDNEPAGLGEEVAFLTGLAAVIKEERERGVHETSEERSPNGRFTRREVDRAAMRCALDYLNWLVCVRGEKHGAIDTVRDTLADALQEFSEKSNEQPSAPASPPLSKSASSTDEAGAGLTLNKPAQHIPGALRCEKHGVTFAFDGDTCWACQEESNAPINS